MKSRKIRCAALLVAFLFASLFTFVQNNGSAYAAPSHLRRAQTIPLPNSFTISYPSYQDETTYTWTKLVDGYWNVGQGRVDSGKWDVTANYPSGDTPHQDLGTVEVGVNTSYNEKDGRATYAADLATTIANIGIQHENIVTTRPLASPNVQQSEWGTAATQYHSYQHIYDVWSPKLLSHKESHLSIGSYHPNKDGEQMVSNVMHMVREQRSAYHQLETVGGAYDPWYTNAASSASVKTAAQPMVRKRRPLSTSVLLLATAGVTLAFAGGIISTVCNHVSCGGNSMGWIISGGIMAVFGVLCVQISGASLSGWQIAAQAAAMAATNEVRPIAQASFDLEQGVSYASRPTHYNVAPQIQRDFGIPEIYGAV